MNHEQIDVIQKPELQRLATEINREHTAAESMLRAGLKHALHCGELLMAAKELVAHGEWLPWLAANCTVSERTAQAYMRVANHRSELKEKSATVADFEDLSFRQGLKLLAAPTTVDESWEEGQKPDSDDPLATLVCACVLLKECAQELRAMKCHSLDDLRELRKIIQTAVEVETFAAATMAEAKCGAILNLWQHSVLDKN